MGAPFREVDRMEVVSTGPLRTATLGWLLSNGAPALTVVCKASYHLQPDESPLAPEQEAPNEDDSYWDDDARKSLSLATDLVPYKARADVVLVGHAFAPEQKPVRSLAARLMVGPIHKAIEVYGERAFLLDGELREGAGFAKGRLNYERAAGGADSTNPVGMRFDVVNSLGMTPLPNLQPSGTFVARRGDTFAAIGFGPIAPGWPGRRNKLHGPATSFGGRGWNEQPLPEGIEPAYFNVAPFDQQMDAIQPNERIVLENLHVQYARLSTRLPGIEPVGIVERPGQPPQKLPLLCDTLWIDTDRGICHLVWRGTVTLTHPAEAGRIVISTSGDGASVAVPERQSREMISVTETTMAPMLVPASHPTMPFAAPRRDDDRSASPRALVRDAALPFGTTDAPASPVQFQPYVLPAEASGDSTVFLFDAPLPPRTGPSTVVLSPPGSPAAPAAGSPAAATATASINERRARPGPPADGVFSCRGPYWPEHWKKRLGRHRRQARRAERIHWRAIGLRAGDGREAGPRAEVERRPGAPRPARGGRCGLTTACRRRCRRCQTRMESRRPEAGRRRGTCQHHDRRRLGSFQCRRSAGRARCRPSVRAAPPALTPAGHCRAVVVRPYPPASCTPPARLEGAPLAGQTQTSR